MSYNWVSASTPQGRERLKELLEGNVAVISMSRNGELSECFIEPDGTIAINHSGYEDWQEVDEMDVLFGLEFLDPSPTQQKDENGLLPCPFCGGKASGIQIPFNFYTVECSACKFFILERETPQLAMAAWNTRAGKEDNP